MNSNDKTYSSSSSTFNPRPPIKFKTSFVPPKLFMGYQPPNLSQFTPGEALWAGTLWKPLYKPYYNPRELARGGSPAWQTGSRKMAQLQQVSANPLTVRKVTYLRMPEQGMEAKAAYKIVHDEIALDGNAQQNLATFVTTWMEPAADQLYAETVNKNLIDKDEYPMTAAIEKQCIQIIAELWHSPNPHHAMGTSTIGSSEGCMLGGIALKRRWQTSRKAQGKPIDRPNIVFSSAVQIVWKKFANYWDVEPRYVHITPDHPHMGPEGVLAVVDENTIGVVSTFGVTYTGLYEPIAAISKALDELQARAGLDIPIHVDAASGGFVAPFLQPDIIWDFQLSRVKSINVSGHKYGLVYPGVGWVIWREVEDLPKDLIFHVSYLGGDMPTFGLNFSRPSSQVLLQYYNFLRLGKEGYYEVQMASQEVAHFLSKAIGDMEPFELFTDGSDIPVLAWRLKEGYTSKWNLYHLSRQLRTYGWQVPAYQLPPDMETVTIMRVVVRNGFSMDLAQFFMMNLIQAVTFLDSLERPILDASNNGFHH